MISTVQAIILGVVEGLTEYLPVSSTGHLILASHFMGLQGEAVKTFEIVIQAGAIAAVILLYRGRFRSKRLLLNLFVSFLPAAVVGLLFHRWIKAHLFTTWPVIIALAVGGVFMVAMDSRLQNSSRRFGATIDSLGLGQAFLIGLAQCLSLWPGTSRAMVTIVAALLLGLSAMEAAEYSFLLALPTLGAATLFDFIKEGVGLFHDVGFLPIACGFVTAGIVAALAIRGFIRYLTRQGLAPFGWYRIALAAVVWGFGPI